MTQSRVLFSVVIAAMTLIFISASPPGFGQDGLYRMQTGRTIQPTQLDIDFTCAALDADASATAMMRPEADRVKTHAPSVIVAALGENSVVVHRELPVVRRE